MNTYLYLDSPIHASRQGVAGHVRMEATNPGSWSVGDWVTIGGFISAIVLWWKKKPWRKIENIWFGPDRVEAMDKKLDAILELTSLSISLTQNTWRVIDRPIWRADADGKTVHVNNFMLKVLCRQESELLGNGWINSIHEDDRERVLDAWNAAILHQTNFHLHYRWVSASGEVIPVVGEASHITDNQGTVLGFMGCITLVDK